MDLSYDKDVRNLLKSTCPTCGLTLEEGAEYKHFCDQCTFDWIRDHMLDHYA